MEAFAQTLRSVAGVYCPEDLTITEGAALVLFAAGALGGLFAEEPTPYSKFSSKADPKAGKAAAKDKGLMVSSRAGMATIYALGTAAGVMAVRSMALEADQDGAASVAGVLVPSVAGLGTVLSDAVLGRSAAALGAVAAVAHFGKRELEVFFVHSYSGSMPLQSAAFISCVYGIVGWGLHHFAARAAASGGLDSDRSAGSWAAVRLQAGIAMFGGGMLVNAVHHAMLARQRAAAKSKDGSKAYVIPRGRLFELVACPHYLAESVQWAGLALALPTPLHILWAAQTVSYLSGRAAHTTAWYQSRFGDAYPASRRHMVPFLY